jgi:UDP-glucose 4-epimerase
MIRPKIVVTGGAGFIGSHIVEAWFNRGAEVHVIDNLRTGFFTNIEKYSGVIFHKGSITERELVFKVLQGTDYVHHLAAFISVPESFENPYECFDINVNGLLNVLDASKEFGIKKIVFSSSAAVYGDNPQNPKKVSLVTEPKSPYGNSKLEGEKHLQSFLKLYDLGAVSLRYFNVFGPKQNPESQYAAAIPIFISKALKNKPIIIYGDGNQTRDFIFVKDIVELNLIAATRPEVNGIFNAATGTSISVLELAQIIISETGSTSQIVFEKERFGDIKESSADIIDTKNILQFSPKISLIDGLKETIQYFVENQNKIN